MVKRFFEFYINASLHVALAVTALAYISCLELGFPIATELLCYVFFGTVSAYNFVKYAKAAGLHHRSLTNSMRAIQIASILSTIGWLVVALKMTLPVFYVSLFFAFLTFLYAVPFVFKQNLRTFSGIKIFIVAWVWAGATVLIPWAYAGTPTSTDLWLTFAQRFLLIVVCTLPFEIRDLPYDLDSLRTLPQRFGVVKVKALGTAFLVLLLILEGFKDDLTAPHSLSLAITLLLVTMLLWSAKVKQPRYYASFWVEAVPLFWLGCFYVMNVIFN